MTIKKPDKTLPAAASAKRRQRKIIITVGFTEERLAEIDLAAEDMGLSRSAWLNLAAARLLAFSNSKS